MLLAWGMGLTMMSGNQPIPLLVTLLTRTGWSALFSLPFLGLAMGASLLVGNPNGARVLAALAFFFMPMAAAVLTHWSGPDTLGRICDLLVLVIPTRYWSDFWSTNATDLAFATGRSILLAVVFFAFGFARFQRRDL